MRWTAVAALLALALLASCPAATTAAAPIVESIEPVQGERTHGTPVWIRGTGLGIGPNDLVSVTVGGESCDDSLQWRSSTLLLCVAHMHSETGNASIANHEVTGPVVVQTRSGGTSNSNVTFTFVETCTVHASKQECGGSCQWCVHLGKCAPLSADCGFPCSTDSFRMTCGELGGIVSLTVLVIAATTGIVWFVFWEQSRLTAAPTKPTSDETSRLLPPSGQRRTPTTPRRSTFGDDDYVDEEDAEEIDEDAIFCAQLSDEFRMRQDALDRKYRTLQASGRESSITSFI